MNYPSALSRPRLEYYAWRHLPFWPFQHLQTIITIFDTLTRIPTEVTEPHVARMKLAFFQSDIESALTGQAKHPDIQALGALLQTDPIDLTPFNNLCIALETEIDRVQSIDDNDLNRYCKRKRGSLLLLCGQLLKKSPLTDLEKSQLENLGVFIERIRLLGMRDARPEILHLFPLKDFNQNEYIKKARYLEGERCAVYPGHGPGAPTRRSPLHPIGLLASLYAAQLNHFEQSKPLSPIKLLALSIYYRMRGC